MAATLPRLSHEDCGPGRLLRRSAVLASQRTEYTPAPLGASIMRVPGRNPPGKGRTVSEAVDIRDDGDSTIPWREIVAGHEAGHAVVAWHYGAHIDLKAGGFRSRRAEAACDLGGYAANITLQHVPADAAWQAAGDDVRRLQDAGVTQDAWTAYIDAASDIVSRRRRQWDRLRTRLLTADSLSWREAATILGRRDPYGAR